MTWEIKLILTLGTRITVIGLYCLILISEPFVSVSPVASRTIRDQTYITRGRCSGTFIATRRRLRASLLRPTNSSPLPRCHETSSSRRKFAVFPRFFLSKTHRFVETLVSRGSPRFLHDATQSMVGNFSLFLILFGSFLRHMGYPADYWDVLLPIVLAALVSLVTWLFSLWDLDCGSTIRVFFSTKH